MSSEICFEGYWPQPRAATAQTGNGLAMVQNF